MIKKKTIIDYYNLYDSKGLIVHSCNIIESNIGDKSKKELKGLNVGYTNIIKNNLNYIKKSHNSLFLNIGTKINNKYLIALDIYDKKSENIYNGINYWNKMIKKYNIDYNTPTAKTGNKGLHYLFFINEEQKVYIKKISINVNNII